MQKFINFSVDTTFDDTKIIENAIFKGDTLTLTIKIYNKGALADLTNQIVDLVLLKADGNPVEGVQKTISNGVITAALTQQATLCEGIVRGTLLITENATSHISTNEFTYLVLPSIADAVLEASKKEINTLQELLLIIANNTSTINEYETLVAQVGTTTQSIQALIDIKNYIDTNLPALESENAEAVTNISNLKAENDKAPTLTANLKTQNDNAASNISTLTAKNAEAVTNKNNLDASNTAALATKSALDTSKTNADTSKAALDTSIENANTAKSALDTSKTNADASKVALEGVVQKANDFAAAHGDIIDLDNRVTQNTAQLSEITQQTGNYKTLEKLQKGQVTYIIAVGDSVTFSVQPHPSTSQVTNPYPSLLQTKLRQIYNNNNITVENQGIPGISASGWLTGTQYNDLVLSKSPDMIILMLGINDIQGGATLSTYENNMTQLITKALSVGIEVVLMTEPMVMAKNDWSTSYQDVNSLVYQYSKICYKLAEKYHISFIDLQQEFIDLFYKSNVYLPSDLINTIDFIHPTQQGYEMISDIVVKNLQQAPVMVIDKPKIVPLVGCPFAESNMKIADVGSGVGLRFNQEYIITTGKYLKFRFLVLDKNLSLNMIGIKAFSGGSLNVYLDGVNIGAVNQYDANLSSNDVHTHFSVKTNLADVLSIGYHELVFDSVNLTKMGINTVFYFCIESLIFEYNNINTQPVQNRIINLPTNIFTAINTNLNNDLVCLKTGKKLIIKMKGYFQNGLGLCIFNNTNLNGSDNILNYLSFLNSKIQLTNYDINSSTSNVTVGTNTLDLTKEIDVRIEIDSSYAFKVYVNNVLELTTTNTICSVQGGFLRLLNTNESAVNVVVSDLSWSYF